MLFTPRMKLPTGLTDTVPRRESTMKPKNAVFTPFILTVILLLTVCSPATPANLPMETATILPSAVPTNFSWPTETITPTPQADFITQNCLDVLPAAPTNFTTKGIIPLENHQTGNTVFLNLQNGDKTKTQVVEKHIDSYALSPDRRTLAYKIYAPTGISLTITDELNSHNQVVINGKSDFGLYAWLNNQQLLLTEYGNWVIFNPYTKQEKSYSTNDFPNYDTDNIRDDWVAIDPTVTRVVYKHTNIFLVDIQSKQILAQVKDGFQRTPVVEWTIDGSKAAIVGTTAVGTTGTRMGDNIFVVDRDGQITQLTHLAEHYGVGFNIRSLSWSPDSRYIALWMNYHKTKQNAFTWVLAIVNTATKAVVDYCVSTNPYVRTSPPITPAVSAPLWSPDGKQIIVEHLTDDSNYVVLVDLTQNIAFQIAQNAYPVGWMLSSK